MVSTDYFERLGLPRRFCLDEAAVERQYLAHSRELHPDLYQTKSGLEQQASLELSAALNEAYTVLREPFRRAEYLLSLQGGPTAAAIRDVPPDFLEEMLELRMEIEEIKRQPGSPAFAAIEMQLNERRQRIVQQISELFENAVDPGRLAKIRRLLNAAKYVQGLLRDLHAD